VARDLTSIGGAGSLIRDWETSNILESSHAQDIFTGPQGAHVCTRYGTAQPLWPWPMDQRIKDAMALSGHSSVTRGFANDDGTVTSAIEQMFGPIPASCKAP
jgi:hypothetical protein